MRKKSIFSLLTSVVAGLGAGVGFNAGAFAQETSDDPYLWLEEIESTKALDWVRAQNKRSLEVLENVPEFEALRDEALSILDSQSRIPYGQIRGDVVYNFWQDASHKRGLWRRASLESYRAGTPDWEMVLDYDALAKAEDQNWIAGSVACLSPEYRHCMIELSDGGKDAGIWREFDTSTKKFVENGFYIPEAKSNLAWFDKDMLLVGTDVGEDALTTSGYPRVVRAFERGAALEEAPVLFEGEKDDVSVSAVVEHEGDLTHVFMRRSMTFYERSYTHVVGDGPVNQLPLPQNVDYVGVLNGRAFFLLRENWQHADKEFKQGSLIAYHLTTGDTEIVMNAASNQSIEDVEIGKSSLVVQYLEDVAGKAARITFRDDDEVRGYLISEIDLPENGVVSIVSVGGDADEAMFSFESMTTPDTLYFLTAEQQIEKIAQADAFYDASDVVVEQRFATSADGEKVPYFIMAQKDVLASGNAPTVQYGYGGFLIPILPVYYSDPGRPQHGALAGKMWVRRGGVLVLSNIRGGSEFGARWHQAALKEKRQHAFDDFIAISEDLIATGVTSPEKLGAVGRSNGGLLMGAIMTQRPDLYAAYDIGVPLLDMQRYNKLLAGASWMAEYGNPDIAEEWAYISEYAPYQNITADKTYAAPFFYTSTKDDRVHPGHARKMAAKMIELGHEVFYYENLEGGHGGTANQTQLAYRTALEYAYFVQALMTNNEADAAPKQ